MNLLNLQEINTGYNNKQVLFDLSFQINSGEFILLVGSNGSGKSTLFKTIYRKLDLWKNNQGSYGTLLFDGEDISNIPSWRLIKKGLVYIPQQNELFEDMKVCENLRMCALHLNNQKEVNLRLDDVFEKIPILKEIKLQYASKLSGGERKLLLFGIALMNRPKLLLFDEPLSGLSGNNVKIIVDWLMTLKDNGITMIVIEHRIKELYNNCSKVIGLKFGKLHSAQLTNLESIKTFMV
jgi:branched-chain amino acid transport system ATP-binding protein